MRKQCGQQDIQRGNAEHAKPSFAPRSDFARAVVQRAREALAAAEEHRFADGRQWLAAFAWLGAGLAAYAGLLLAGAGAGGCIAFATAAALCAFMVLVSIGHGATHGSASPRTWVNSAVVFCSFGLLGVSGSLWRHRHLRLHHQFANVPDTGIDADSSGALRLSPYKPWRALHAWQPLYAPVLYAFGFLYLVWVEDFAYFAQARRSHPAQYRTGGALAAFAGTKVLHILVWLILPALTLPAPVAAAAYLLAMCTASIAFTVLAIGTHLSDLAEFPQPDDEGRLPYDWATHQVRTSVDWSATRPWITALVGGANAEAAHHLFPAYSHRHAGWLSDIIREEAPRHGIPYHDLSFGEMMRAHWRLLTNLRRQDGSAGAQAVAAV